MAEVVLFHHILGLTNGVRSLANELQRGGHDVLTPDLFGGVVTSTIDEGFAHMKSINPEELERRTAQVLDGVAPTAVLMGISFGAGTAQELVMSRPGALGAVLLEACLPTTGEWAVGPWPAGVPVQIHGMDRDPFFALEGDIDSARIIVSELGPDLAQLFTYPGDQHLFTDDSLPSCDPSARALVIDRTLEFLDRVR